MSSSSGAGAGPGDAARGPGGGGGGVGCRPGWRRPVLPATGGRQPGGPFEVVVPAQPGVYRRGKRVELARLVQAVSFGQVTEQRGRAVDHLVLVVHGHSRRPFYPDFPDGASNVCSIIAAVAARASPVAPAAEAAPW